MKTIGNNKGNRMEFKAITGQDIHEIETVKQLFLEYTQSLELDLAFQDFETEFNTLPGKYAAPDGVLLVAFIDGQAAGCIALRKIAEGICEMKRLYVRDAYRGFRVGKRLIEMIIEKASQLPYDYMRLDTLPAMIKAQDLYRSFGFYEIEPYVFNPIEGAKFMELKLRKP
ncbi:GNAT family N-acetyltransferase [Brevibacillus sp. NRS-1366]|uniref:GNAT family N-acetyltransferase n=1 Tax=Brevibacillus sp. NRS-1366 TaxID=3233899 RepID=UPI003D1A1DC5